MERRFTNPYSTDEIVVDGEPKRVVVNKGLLLDWEKGSNNAFLNPFDFGGNFYSGLQYTKYTGFNVPRILLRSLGMNEDLSKLPAGVQNHVGLLFLPDTLKDRAIASKSA